jgi:hypothetical protein
VRCEVAVRWLWVVVFGMCGGLDSQRCCLTKPTQNFISMFVSVRVRVFLQTVYELTLYLVQMQVSLCLRVRKVGAWAFPAPTLPFLCSESSPSSHKSPVGGG